ncbi:hypothetical protein CFK41_16720 [Brachybacterium ginsengisoli]|uniref:Uncharacterized protein n=1 Tax=Brachybacterium ginsengisoli TaxID=1331682 RepID=A0A291H1J9_9MICO|nr:hypothetical protein [Brachybacterium ginsengisoli]ATG56236.1 hypothetical protein CFK41_16720 [Brachybacterium ginsengisoli]
MTMIRYDEVAGLTGEKAQRVQALIDRSTAIWDMPDSLETVRAWEEQIAACEAEGVPHLAASGRFGQYALYSTGGMPLAALEAFVRLMQIVSRYGDHIRPENLQAFLGTVANLVVTVGEDPAVTRPQLERVVDLVEQQTVRYGFDLANVTLARASLAVLCGEQERALELLDQWQGIGSAEWPPFDANTVTREAMILEPFDPAEAAATLTRRFTAMGVEPGPIDMHRDDSRQLVLLRAEIGSLSARAGKKDVASRIGDELIDQLGIDRLLRTAKVQDLLLVLEHRPDDARVVADFGLENSGLDHVDWRLQASLARSRALDDPAGEEATLLRALATEAAAAHDARGGTDLHTRELQDFWFADLPAAAPGDGSADEDPDERAERILRAGWIPRRTSPVTMESVPFAIKDRYVALHEQAMSVTEAGSDPEVEAVVEATIARSRELGMPSAEFVARLMHVFHAYEADDHEALVLRFATAQEAQALAPDGVEPALEKAAAGLFLPVCFIALDLPTIPLDRLGAMITAETALRAVTGMPTTPIAVAELARAAQLGQDAEYGPLFEEVRTRLAADAGDVDPFDVQLDLARILAPVDASAVPGLVAGVLRASNDPAQQRAALAWTVWGALQEGEGADDAVAAVIAQLEAVDRDLEEFGDLPRSVVLEVAARIPEARGWVLDAALADTTPGDPTHLDTFAGAARLLLEHAPADERGPRLREDARRIAAALDRRNGNAVQSERLRTRFFPEG